MVTTSTEEDHVELVRGPAARRMLSILLVVAVIEFLYALSLYMWLLTTSSTAHPATPALLLGFAFNTLLLTVGVPWAYFRQRDREFRAGYTTIPAHYDDLANVDPRSGRILRHAGDPPLRDTSRGPRIGG